MSEKQVKVAIIGLGFGAEFIPIYQKHPNALMYGICRRDESELNAIGDQFGIEKRFTRYEDVLSDPREMIGRISREFSYSWKGNGFTNLEESTKEKSKSYAFYRQYYLGEEWKEELSPNSIAVINEKLDPRVLRHFGYERLS